MVCNESKRNNKKNNIILIVIDACRADHLSCYGYSRKTSPNIDKIAKEGILFENAFSCTNATDPSVTTILSGKYPVSHGIRNHGPKVTDSMIREFYKRKIKFLSEILREYNYRTFGIDWLGRWHKKGFDYYFGDNIKKINKKYLYILYMQKIYNTLSLFSKLFGKKCLSLRMFQILKDYNLLYIYDATELTDITLKLINRCDKPFFILVHYWDTHTPYNAPENIYTKFKPSDVHNGVELKKLLEYINNEKWKEYLLKSFGELATAKEVIAMYDSAIRYVDEEIGRLADFLKDKGIYDNTAIIITSDHGESLTEHDIFFDHHGLYDVSIHVPLIFSIPWIDIKRKRFKEFVQHVDIVPTILDVLNIPVNRYKFDGMSLVPVMMNELNFTRSFIIAEESYTEKKIAIRTKNWKYIYSPSIDDAVCEYCGIIHGGVEELYYLRRDPKEVRNIISEKSEVAMWLKRRLFILLSNLKIREEKMLISQKISKLKRYKKI